MFNINLKSLELDVHKMVAMTACGAMVAMVMMPVVGLAIGFATVRGRLC